MDCLSGGVVWLSTATQRPDEYRLATSSDAIRLRPPHGDPLWFTASQNFHFVKDQPVQGEWKVKTDAYVYSLTDDHELSHELVSWHWHPPAREQPHIHIGRNHPALGAIAGIRGVGRLHVPSGRVLFEDVVRFFLDDLLIAPQREDWKTVLDDVATRVRAYKTW